MTTLAKKLKIHREDMGLTQEELAAKLEIKRATYARYETGENRPKHKNLKKIAAEFGVSTDYLLAEEDEVNYEEGYKILVAKWKKQGKTPQDIEKDEMFIGDMKRIIIKYMSK